MFILRRLANATQIEKFSHLSAINRLSLHLRRTSGGALRVLDSTNKRTTLTTAQSTFFPIRCFI